MSATSVTVIVAPDLTLSLSGPAASSCSVAPGPRLLLRAGWHRTLLLSVPAGARVPAGSSGIAHGAVIDTSEPGSVLLKGWPVPHPDGDDGGRSDGNFPMSLHVPLEL